jgi:cytidyltransferase-like protein
LDTRGKIIDTAGFQPVHLPAILVAGFFDPLTAAHARRLRELSRIHSELIVAVVEDPPAPLLQKRARMELLAALKAVDYVAPSLAGALTAFPAAAVVDERSADLDRQAALIDHVIARHRTA